jgi:regulator of protease activity HflC (stomatin/prohibitin superfamily)
VREAEFSDLYRADILLEVICQIVKPRALVFTYRERFFPNVERAVQAAVIDYLRKFEGGYDAFITGGITGSQSPFYWEALNPLNFGDQGLIQEFGVYMIDARVVHIKLAKLNQDAQDALLAEKVAIATGKGVVAEAKARAEAIKTVADAEAEALRAQIAASSEEVMKAKLRKEALVENEVVTHLVEHGAVQVQIQK